MPTRLDKDLCEGLFLVTDPDKCAKNWPKLALCSRIMLEKFWNVVNIFQEVEMNNTELKLVKDEYLSVAFDIVDGHFDFIWGVIRHNVKKLYVTIVEEELEQCLTKQLEFVKILQCLGHLEEVKFISDVKTYPRAVNFNPNETTHLEAILSHEFIANDDTLDYMLASNLRALNKELTTLLNRNSQTLKTIENIPIYLANNLENHFDLNILGLI